MNDHNPAPDAQDLMPPGWYPDPARPGYQREWNGTAWGTNSVPVAAKGGFPKWLIPVIACLALGFFAVVAAAIAGDPEEEETTTEETTTTDEATTTESTTTEDPAPETTEATTTTTEPPPVTAPTTAATEPVVPPGCTPADQADVDRINLQMVPRADHIGNTFVVVDPEGFRYIGATIYTESNGRLSWEDLWIITPDGQIHASTLSAKSYSAFPEADTLPGDRRGISDPYGAEATACNDAAVRGG